MAKKRQATGKSKTSRKLGAKKSTVETDSTFLLKLVIFLILGSQWIYIERMPDWQIPIPAGLFIGLIFATHEHFQIDRKIEYVVLLFAAFISFWLPLGLNIKV